jgi:hypothetical protein
MDPFTHEAYKEEHTKYEDFMKTFQQLESQAHEKKGEETTRLTTIFNMGCFKVG